MWKSQQSARSHFYDRTPFLEKRKTTPNQLFEIIQPIDHGISRVTKIVVTKFFYEFSNKKITHIYFLKFIFTSINLNIDVFDLKLITSIFFANYFCSVK